jgi:hypothetical protein
MVVSQKNHKAFKGIMKKIIDPKNSFLALYVTRNCAKFTLYGVPLDIVRDGW